MAYKTKAEVVEKIERDLDLEDEEFIQVDEMTEYINDAITIIEAHLVTLGLHAHYYLTTSMISLVSGTADYALPVNIYEGKIKELVYSNGATIYGVNPIPESTTLEEIEHLNRFSTTECYQYRLRTDAADDDYVLQLIPASRETVSNVLKIDYYRDAARVSADDDVVEVPTVALQFLYQYVKLKVYEKESHANYPTAKQELDELEELMLSTLQSQLADNKQNVLEMDKSIYEEIS